MTFALEINSVSCRYGKETVLDSLCLEVADGDIVCLLGASGCGKTTLLKAIAGLLPVQSGRIHLQGRPIDAPGLHVLPEKRHIGLIFQDYALFPHLNVRQNIGFGLRNKTKQEQQIIVDEMLSLVRLNGLEARYQHQLSGGQQQRVAIARSLACQPDLLLLDEPFSNIDTQVRHELIAEIRQLFKQQAITAIFVTHSREEAFAFSDKLAMMNQGRIEQFGTASELYYSPSSPFVADFLGGGSYLEATKISDTCFQTVLGEVKARSVGEIEVGERCLVMLRPHHLSLTESVPSHYRVVEQQFMGDHCRYVVEVGESRITATSESAINTGEAVSIQLHDEGIVAFPCTDKPCGDRHINEDNFAGTGTFTKTPDKSY